MATFKMVDVKYIMIKQILHFNYVKECIFQFQLLNQTYIIESLSHDNNGIIINRNKYIGIFNIDGCGGNLLSPPLLFGDLCLNVSYFIKNLSQTPHTHPAFRIGIVTNGFGYFCLKNDQKVELLKDLLFLYRMFLPQFINLFGQTFCF